MKSSQLLKDDTCDSSKSCLLVATASHDANHLFWLIDTATGILVNHKQYNCIVIELHPVAPVDFAYLVNFYWHALLYAFSIIMSTNRSEKAGKYPFYYRAFFDLNGLLINTSYGKIKIIRKSPFGLFKATLSFSSLFETLKCWSKIVKNDRLNVSNLLTLNFRGIQIGDLVASYSLRFELSSARGIQKCKKSFLFKHIKYAIASVLYIDKAVKVTSGTFVVTTEPTYLHSIYSRYIHKNGGFFVNTHSPSRQIDYISSTLPYPDYTAKSFILNSNDSDLAYYDNLVRQYMGRRLFQPSLELSYMQKTVNSICLKEQIPNIVNGDFVVVLFLHSFDDGQFYFGYDGFDDLLDWTLFTIDNLLKNKSVNSILLKPHPNVDYDAHTSDAKTVAYIESMYSKEPRVNWLDKLTKISSLAEVSGLVGITHHGSVVEELYYLGVDVIGSTFSPWGTNYKFLATWSSPKQYEKLLGMLPRVHYEKVAIERKRDFTTYVSNYRLSDYSDTNRFFWLRLPPALRSFFCIDNDSDSSLNYEKLNTYLLSLTDHYLFDQLLQGFVLHHLDQARPNKIFEPDTQKHIPLLE